MNIKLSLITILMLCNINCYSFKDKLYSKMEVINFNSSDSFFTNLDSIVIEYSQPANAEFYKVNLNPRSVIIKNDIANREVALINSDTISRLTKYVDALFISGNKKTEVGRTYSSNLTFTEHARLDITLYSKGKTHLTHLIYLSFDNYKVEFSSTFRKFQKLLDELCEKVEVKY